MSSEGKHNSSKDSEMDFEEDALLTHTLNSLINESGLSDQVSLNNNIIKNPSYFKGSFINRQQKRNKEKKNINDTLTFNKIQIVDVNSPPTTHIPSITGSLIFINDSIRRNRYSENHGLFDIHIQWIRNPSASLHPITNGRLINRFNIDGIIDIKKAGYSKVSVFLQTGQAANSLTEDLRRRKRLNNIYPFFPYFQKRNHKKYSLGLN